MAIPLGLLKSEKIRVNGKSYEVELIHHNIGYDVRVRLGKKRMFPSFGRGLFQGMWKQKADGLWAFNEAVKKMREGNINELGEWSQY